MSIFFRTKSIIVFTFLLLFLNHLNAQWSSGSNKVYISSTSTKVGIGTNNPQKKLHVLGGDILMETDQGVKVAMGNWNFGTDYNGILYTVTNHDLYLGANNSEKMVVKTNGNIGIGTSNPSGVLEIDGGSSKIKFGGTGGGVHHLSSTRDMAFNADVSGTETAFTFRATSFDNIASYTDLLKITGEGNVGIGTSTPDKGKLQVKGSFHVENSTGNQVFHVSAGKELVFVGNSAYTQYEATLNDPNSPVQENNFSLWVSKGVVSEDYAVASVSDWDDYVFNEDYDLPALEKVAAFIKTNKHLPNIPSEAEVKANGYSLHQLNRNFLQTIEELTLYTIDQEKEIQALKEKNMQQEVQYDQLATEVAALKAMLQEMNK